MISAASAEHYNWAEVCDGWHLVKCDTLSVIQERMPAGTSERRHYHERARQFFFVLRGLATIEIDGKLVTLREREGVEVAPGVAHTMMNRSDADVEFLVVSAPRAHGDRHPA
jgi:mannose-6-phosphate isomerase-like protein (cupin superfamily)